MIDSDHRLLFRDGERVLLPPKAADVLIALVEREGELIGKSELLEQVWPDTFVEEGSLARHIFLLRKTLGETEAGVSYVETVPKRGYRFMGRVQRDGPNTYYFHYRGAHGRTHHYLKRRKLNVWKIFDRANAPSYSHSARLRRHVLAGARRLISCANAHNPALGRFARWRYCHSSCSAAILKTSSWNWESQTRSFRS